MRVHVCIRMLYMCFIHVCIICTYMPCMHVYIYVKEECNLDMVRALSALDAAPLSQTSFREEVRVGRGKLSNVMRGVSAQPWLPCCCSMSCEGVSTL